MDYLSVSPSLVPILSLVGQLHIFPCLLVSRRFYSVIKNHPETMPRHIVHVNIDILPQTESIEGCAVVNLGNRWHRMNMSIHVHERRITVHFGLSHPYSRVLPDPIDRREIDSMLEGVHAVLEPLCHHFDMILEISDAVPSDWHYSISEIQKRNRCFLHKLDVPSWPDLDSCLPMLGSLTINWAKEVSLCLPKMYRHGFIKLNLNEATDEAKGDIIEFFQGWYAGRYRMPAMTIRETGAERWIYKLAPHLLVLFPNCTKREVPYTPEPEDEIQYNDELFIRRPADDAVLCLSYQNMMESLYVHEAYCTSSEEFEELSFNYELI